MQRGQTSLDLIFAFIVAALFFTFMTTQTDTLEADLEKQAMRTQVKAILLDAYAVVSSIKAQNRAIDEMSVAYSSPVIRVGNKQTLVECHIFKNGPSSLTVATTTLPTNIVETYSGLDLTGIKFSKADFKCGEPIKFTRT